MTTAERGFLVVFEMVPNLIGQNLPKLCYRIPWTGEDVSHAQEIVLTLAPKSTVNVSPEAKVRSLP